MDSAAILLYLTFFGFTTAWLADRRGYRWQRWFVLGMLLGALPALLLMLKPRPAASGEDPPVAGATHDG